MSDFRDHCILGQTFSWYLFPHFWCVCQHWVIFLHYTNELTFSIWEHNIFQCDEMCGYGTVVNFLQWTTESFNLSPEGSAWKENKLDCFEHKHIFCFKLQCASIVYLLCTALWWQIERRGDPWHIAQWCLNSWALADHGASKLIATSYWLTAKLTKSYLGCFVKSILRQKLFFSWT